MKKLVLLVMIAIVIYSCKDEDRPIQQEEEVIEEINYYAYSDGHGDYCDSIKIDSFSFLLNDFLVEGLQFWFLINA